MDSKLEKRLNQFLTTGLAGCFKENLQKVVLKRENEEIWTFEVTCDGEIDGGWFEV